MVHVIPTPESVPPRTGSGYPEPFDAPCQSRRKHALGDAAGIRNFGINYTVLPPGAWSSQRHWHRVADEFIVVMEGELTLITDAGETTLTKGMSAGFPAGTGNGHHLVNRSGQDAAYLEIGDRLPGDSGEYPDIDMQFSLGDGGSKGAGFFHKDGTPYPKKTG